MLLETRDNVDIKYYICFLRIPKTGCIIRVSREKCTGTAVMDTGSSGSFISLGYVRKHRLQMKTAAAAAVTYPWSHHHLNPLSKDSVQWT